MEPTTPTPDAGDEIGTVLAILRCASGCSLEHLAAISRISRTSISAYERGQADPGLKEAIRLVAAMGYSLAALDHTRRYLEALRTGSYIVLAPAVREAMADLRRPPGRSGAKRPEPPSESDRP